MKTKTLIPLIAILALAALLRFWNLDATEFKYDEATVCNLAAHFVDTGLPPARGNALAGYSAPAASSRPTISLWPFSFAMPRGV